MNLSPAARAFLKLVEGFVLAGFATALPVVAPLLAAQSINWHLVIETGAGAFGVAFLMAVSKFYKAHGDAPLATLAADAAQVVENKAGVGGPVIPFSAPATTAASGVGQG